MTITKEDIARYRNDFRAFAYDMPVQTTDGIVQFGRIAVDFQRKAIDRIAPSLLAIAEGRQPPCTRFAFLWTKGCGKDTILALAVLWLVAFARLPRFGQCMAAKKEQADELIKAARTWLYLSPWLASRVEIQNWRIVCEATRSEFEIEATQEEGIHGSRPDVLIVNECHAISRWDAAQSALLNADKIPHNITILASNAGLLGTGFHQLYEIAKTSPRWDVQEVTFPAPWIAPDAIEEMRRRDRPRANRFYFGQWSTGSGDALDEQDITEAITLHGPHDFPLYDYYLAGVDLSDQRDRSSVVVVGLDIGFRRVVLAQVKEWRPEDCRGTLLTMVQAEIERLHARLGLSIVIFDPYNATQMMENLNARGIRAERWPQCGPRLDDMARGLLELFRDRLLAMYKDESLLKDLRELSLVEKDYGYRLSSRRTRKGHSDCAVALSIVAPTALTWLKDMAAETQTARAEEYVFT